VLLSFLYLAVRNAFALFGPKGFVNSVPPANRHIARDGPEFGTPQGSHEESVRVPTGDLLRVSEAEVADICVD
jgi:hypothetical protein